MFVLAFAAWPVQGQPVNGPTFEVASVKPATGNFRGCSGGPNTSDPGTWRCSGVVLSFLITNAYGFQPSEFSLANPCCQERYELNAKLPPGSTQAQFHEMEQNLLKERFKLAFHFDRKEMQVYELSVAEKGSKMRESAPGVSPQQQDPWSPPKYTVGKDGYPSFRAGEYGVAGVNGRYRWLAVGQSMEDIVKTLSFQLGRPVVDTTGLTGKYDIDLKWTIDFAAITERLAKSGAFGDNPADVPVVETPAGPDLPHAIVGQLGLKVTSKKGPGRIVVIDHVEKVPLEN